MSDKSIRNYRRVPSTRTVDPVVNIAVADANAPLKALRISESVAELVGLSCAVRGALDDLHGHTHALSLPANIVDIAYFRGTAGATAMVLPPTAQWQTRSATLAAPAPLPVAITLDGFDAAERHLGMLMTLRAFLRSTLDGLLLHTHPLSFFVDPSAQGAMVRTAAVVPSCLAVEAVPVADPAVLFSAAQQPAPPPSGTLANRVAQAESQLADLAGDFDFIRQQVLAYRAHTHTLPIGLMTYANLPAGSMLVDGRQPWQVGSA